MSKTTTKIAIAFAFKELLLEKPLDKITVNDITEKCEMNRLELLPARERRPLMYRYGIQSLEYKTIAETAAFFHLTENYLRLIEKRALNVLREGMNDGKIL